MEQRTLGRTGRKVSTVGLGTWQLGADWGDVDPAEATAVLEAAVESGVTFFDTADVYGDGRSEQTIGAFLRERPDLDITVATKMGRRADQVPENYTLANFRQWVDRSRRNLGTDTLDLVQLHCPPTPVYSDQEVYDALDTLVQEGAIRHYGVSVERTDEALAAIARGSTATVQIILNAFRLKPLDAVLPAAKEAGVGIIARVPLASGLLSGKYTADTRFAADDHRNYNRGGEAFDVGETFSGVDFQRGLEAVREFAGLLPDGVTTAQAAIAWIIAQDGVSTVIPGARSVERTDEALAAIARGSTATVQIILNTFRLKPLDAVLPAAKEAGIGIIARVPLASGLLSGKYTPDTRFAADDHRNYNRGGEAFDVGETFSGVDFQRGLEAVREFAGLLPEGVTTAQAAIAWIIAQDGVSTVIPGARSVEQVRGNASAADTGDLGREIDAGVRRIYDAYFRADIHPRW